MTRRMDNPNIGKPRAAQPYASKTASFYNNQSAGAAGVQPVAPAKPVQGRARPAPAKASLSQTASLSSTAGNSNSANMTHPGINSAALNTANLTGAFPPPRRRSSTSFKIALFSLLTSLVGLSVIFAMQVEMKGAGAYLYLLVTLSAFVYIVATMFYVVMSTRSNR